MVTAMRRLRPSLRYAAAASVMGVTAIACGGDPPRVLRPVTPPRATSGARAPSLPPMFSSTVVGDVDGEDALQLIARRGDEALVVLGAQGKLTSRVVGLDGKPKAQLEPLIDAPADLQLATLKATADGYVLA